MPRDSLNVLLLLRQQEVDRQRQELADCSAAEIRAAGTVRAIDAALARDSEDGSADGLLFRDIVLATRQHLRAQRQHAVAALAEAEARSDDARGRLAAARLAAEAVDRLILERRAAARAERRAQHALDDIARSRRK
jgi:hypothetical protein